MKGISTFLTCAFHYVFISPPPLPPLSMRCIILLAYVPLPAWSISGFYFNRKPLTTFDATVNGVNELDLKLQEIRNGELQCIVEEASKLREQATDVHEAMEEVNSYLNRLHDLCSEVNLVSDFFQYELGLVIILLPKRDVVDMYILLFEL